MKHLFGQRGDGQEGNWSLKVFHQCNECLAGAHPLPVEVSQPAQPQLHDCLHLLHQVSLLHPWLFVQEVYTPSPRCGRVLSKPGGAWWCDRCRAPPARCSVCHAVVKGLFVWCQVKYKLIVYPTYNYQRIKKTWAFLPLALLYANQLIAIFRVVAMGAMFFVCSNGWRSRRVALLAAATNVSTINLSQAVKDFRVRQIVVIWYRLLSTLAMTNVEMWLSVTWLCSVPQCVKETELTNGKCTLRI